VVSKKDPPSFDVEGRRSTSLDSLQYGDCFQTFSQFHYDKEEIFFTTINRGKTLIGHQSGRDA